MATSTILYYTAPLFIPKHCIYIGSLTIRTNKKYYTTTRLLSHNMRYFSCVGMQQPKKQLLLNYNKIFPSTNYFRSCKSAFSSTTKTILTSHAMKKDSNENECTATTELDNNNNIINTNNSTYNDIRRSNNKYKKLLKKIDYKKVKIEAEKKTKDWVENIVVALSLCPFASKPVEDKSLKTVVNFSQEEKTIGLFIIEEMTKLLTADPATKSSTLIVAPYFHPDDFYSFMTFVAFFEGEFLNDNEEYEGDGDEVQLGKCFQILPFHPQFEFQDPTTSSGVDNYTNRSPYPTFHLLREDEVSYAVKLLGGDSSKVWDRNVQLMIALEKRFGIDGVKKIMSVNEEIDDEEIAHNVMDILEQNPPFSWGRRKNKRNTKR